MGEPGRGEADLRSADPAGDAKLGQQWKAAVADHYTHHVSMDAHGAHQSYRNNYLDLDPNYKDIHGQPLLRMTFDWQDNDIKMSQFMHGRMHKIAEAMDPKLISGAPKCQVPTSIPPCIKPHI